MGFKLSNASGNEEWDSFNQCSLQGTIYSKRQFLQALQMPVSYYFIREPDGQICAATHIIEDVPSRVASSVPFPFVPYQTILFSAKIEQLKEHKKIFKKFQIIEFLINSLTQKYKNFGFSLVPQDYDLRPFLWHNYDGSGNEKFSVTPRYTAVLNISNFNKDLYLADIRTVRRQEIKKCTASVSTSDDIDLFMDLYKKTFDRQNITIEFDQFHLVRSICASAVLNGYGKLMKAQTTNGVASMALFLFDDKTAYYQFGANDPDLRASGASSKLMFEALSQLSEKKIQQIDFVGVNSPNRGDYKLSFNPALKQYFTINCISC